MLNSLAIELAQVFLDLPAALGAFLVEGNADLAVGRGHRLGGEAGVFALDVEITDLAEVEDPLVEPGPVSHPPGVDVVRQVVDDLQPRPDRVLLDPRLPREVDVPDRQRAVAVDFVTVDEVDQRMADAPD